MVRGASSVVLHRSCPDLEVFLVERSPRLTFFGGYHAFPGGAVERTDGDVPLRGAGGLEPASRAAIACAARELFEEVGVLAGVDAAPAVSHETTFDTARRESGAEVDASLFTLAARFVTPRFSKIRFDTRFYLLETRAAPEIRSGELASGAWWRPAAALDAWRRNDLLIAPPTLIILEQLACGSLTEAVSRLLDIPAEYEGSGAAIPWTAGVEVLPLESPPLPPTIPTNVFFVGERRFVLIDPAPRGREAKQHLLDALGKRLERGDRLEAVVLTHHHVDHVGALEDVLAKAEAPVWAHKRTGELLARRLERELGDGDRIELGTAPDGTPDWGLRCCFTPGHAEGHLAFHDEHYGVLIAGDLVSTLVSMYVGSPGGHLGNYFQSLEKIRALDASILYPAHGPATIRVEELLDQTVSHRRKRIEEVTAALQDGEVDVETLAARVYAAADERLRPLFVRTTRAALEYLVEHGEAVKCGDDRFAAAVSRS